MTNVKKLRGKMVEKNITIENLAKRLGMNRSTLYRKLNNDADTLLVKEANAIVTELGLSADEAMAIFFSQIWSHETRQRKGGCCER